MKRTITSVASLAAFLVADGNSLADLPPPSDAFSVFDASGHHSSVLEYYENGDSSVMRVNGFWTVAPPGGALVFTGILGAAGMMDEPLFLLDASGSLADVFGVFKNPANGESEIAFVANSSANPITLVPPPGTVFMTEPVGFFSVTHYLDTGLQQQGYTATFASKFRRRNYGLPENVDTCCLLAVCVTALIWLRRTT